MAGIWVDLQGGIGDRRREPLLRFAREEGILLSPQHQRRRLDLAQPKHVIVLDGERRLLQIVDPYPRRELEAFGDHHIEELLRNRLVDRALLEAPDELGRDGVFQRTHLLHQASYILVRWRLRADQDETTDPVRVVKRQSLREEGTCRSTYDGRFFDSEHVHERIYVGGEVLRSVATLGLVRVPVPALGEGDGVVLGGEQGEHPAEGEPRV